MQDLKFTYHLDEIHEVAKNVLKHFTSKTILFHGDIGAGKTTFINALLNVMGSTDSATSPTFSIVNEYEVLNNRVYHFDFYRIESIEEAYNFGIEEYLNSNQWIFVEWPENVEELLPANAQSIEIKVIEENKRSLKLTIDQERLTLNTAETEVNL
ncbi:MAG: tRNA (adenosine(37)-N6)-threonylcarbamoyltransferase complex ATPase subunit type 1 TsaE [Winogradskyella sp.]